MSFYAIERKETGRVIGNIDCGKRDFDAREVGYIINKSIRGADTRVKLYPL